MSPRPDWCALCLKEWQAKPIDVRKKTSPRRALTTVNKTRVCTEHIDEALELTAGVQR